MLTYRRKSGNAGPYHQNLAGRDLARGRYLAREKSAEMFSRLYHRPVSGHVRHRAQRIAFLRPGYARDRVHRYDRHLPPGAFIHKFPVLCRPEKAGKNLTLVHHLDLFTARRTNLHDDIATLPQGPGVRDYLHPGCPVLFIGKFRPGTRTGFNSKGITEFL
jgi:hypothetical protein